MKIAMVSEGNFGGIYRYTLELEEGLKKEGIGVDNFWIKKRTHDELMDIAKNLKNYSIIHIQHEYSLFGKASIYFNDFLKNLKKNSKAKIIFTMHSVRSQKEKLGLLGPVKKLVFRINNYKINAYGDLIIVHTESAKNILINEYGFDKNKIDVIPMWVSKIKLKSKKSFFKNKKILLCWGFIQPHKNYESVIKSLTSLPQNICLEIIGSAHPSNFKRDVDYINNLKKLITELQLNSRVKIVDKYLPDSELDKYIFGSNLILLPYRMITTSAVFFRSIAFKKPIIASNIDFFKEINKATSFPIISSDSDLPKKIEFALNKNTYSKNINTCLKKYNLNNISKEYRKIYYFL
jgi:glycosyltransferase involved in cell wall biosynthesis